MDRCDWCQEISDSLVPVVNRNQTVSRDFDMVCPNCSAVEQFEHAHEVIEHPLKYLYWLKWQKARMTASLYEQYA
ncbi:MAG: hypothetical protein J2P36_23190 [Ktedonobacteraceae bacterium]|nr:hypothetical protein [Ktedonobacteraceae bacterium]